MNNSFLESPIENALISLENEIPVEQIFDPAVWNEPLGKFAKATGLTISLYDKESKRRCGVMTSGPIGERLIKAGFWEVEGIGSRIDKKAATECVFFKRAVYSVQLEMFSHLAIPLTIDGDLMAVMVLGWIPDRFADPVNCDAVSKKIAVESLELWQLLRMQQPISKEKLETHAGMLETFAGPLMQQLAVRMEDRRRTRRAKIVSETALAFAEATTERQLCAAVFASFQRLTSAKAMSIHIVKSQGESEDTANYVQTWVGPDASEDVEDSLSRHWTLPVLAAHGRSMGTIVVTLSDAGVPEEAKAEVHLLVSQFAIALQKVHLIQALESERSALKGANTQLQHLHKMKDEFLATVSHELRTPLNAVLGWSQMLIEEGAGMPDFDQAVSTIERNAKNQLHLIEDLLDVSRIISGKMILLREDVEATSILKQSVDTVFPMFESRRQKVHLQLSSTPLFLKGDATRITQIFWNLLSNASKFTPEGGDISVQLESAGHYLRLAVTDSGKGISAEFLPQLFDRFSQADGSFTRRHGGLGLGLAIVRHLVELHGGTVSAKSDGEGKGSTFTVFLPQNTTDQELDNAQTLTQFADNRPAKPSQQLKDVKILLIDDEPDSLRLARFVLEKRGALVETTDNASQGFQKLKEWRPHVLISDISMPDESGYELIRRVRFLTPDEGGLVPAVALTALASREKRELALSAGFQTHLTKPLEPNVLVDAVVQLLTRSTSRSK